MITAIIIAIFPVVQYLLTGVIFGAALPIAYLFVIAASWGVNKFRAKQAGAASVEVPQRDPAMGGGFAIEKSRHEEARDDEEDVDADISAR